MDDSPGWLRRRKMTIMLAVGLIGWYTVQMVVLSFFGEAVARSWFYMTLSSSGLPAIAPGIIFAPISHRLFTPTHIVTNVVLLVVAGGFAEPYIGKTKMVVTVLGFGSAGLYIANATAALHGFWNFAGISAGVLSLWAYAGIQTRAVVISTDISDPTSFVNWFVAALLLSGTPLVLLLETVAGFHSGHVIGILLGYLYAVISVFFDITD